jgi:hypothetical protein
VLYRCSTVASSFTSGRASSDGVKAAQRRAELGCVLTGKGEMGAAVDGALFIGVRLQEGTRKVADVFNRACNQ